MHTIRINRAKRLADEPHSGHNRYHPDITPVLEVAEGEEVILETRDALDGQLAPGATVADLASVDRRGARSAGNQVDAVRYLYQRRNDAAPAENAILRGRGLTDK
jgi:hypothetical protein